MKKLRLIKICLLFLMFIMCSSCGTLFCTPSYAPALTITSSVPNAEVYFNGKFVGTTPYSHFGDKVDVGKITVKKDGYKSQTQKPRKLKTWAYINFIPWPMWNWIWGYFLDRSKDKCWEYKKDQFYFELEKE